MSKSMSPPDTTDRLTVVAHPNHPPYSPPDATPDAVNPERGARIKEARRSKRWNRSQLARASGLNAAQVAQLELGAEPTVGVLSAVAAALGVSALFLLCGKTPEPRDEQQILTGHPSPQSEEINGGAATVPMTFLERIEGAAAADKAWSDAYGAFSGRATDEQEHSLNAIEVPFIQFLDDMPNWPEITSMDEVTALLRLSAENLERLAGGVLLYDSGLEGMRDRAIEAFARLSSTAGRDEKLVDAAERFIAAEIDMLKLHYGPERIADEHERDRAISASDYGDRLFAALQDLAMPAISIAGLRAKALAAATWDLELLKPGPGSESEVLLSSLVEDLVGDYDAVAVAKGERPPFDLRAPHVGGNSLVATPHQDAELIAVCNRIVREYDWFYRVDATPEGDVPGAEEFFALIKGMVDRLGELRAVTAGGIVARARALERANPAYKNGPAHSWDYGDINRMLDYLVRDAAQLGASPDSYAATARAVAVPKSQRPETKRPPAPCIPHPDGALLLLSEMYKRNERDYSAMAGTQREMSEEGDRNYDNSERFYVAAGQHQAKTVEGLRARLQMLGPIRIGHIAKLISGPSLGDQALLNGVVGDLNRLADEGLPSIPYRDDPADQEWMIQLRKLYRAVGAPTDDAEEDWAEDIVKTVLAKKPTTLRQCYILLAFIVGEVSTYRDRGEPDPSKWSTRKAMSNVLAGLGNIVGMNIMDYAGNWWPNLNDQEVVWK